jgi:branched-chain amino acid transport system permease protein
VLSVIANTVITNADKFLGGAAGLALVPPPLSEHIDPNTETYQYLYVGMTIVAVVVAFALVNRIVNSPYGRSLRAMRERELAAAAIGKNPVQLKMTIFIVGGVIAGLSGAILVGFIQLWAPSVWLYPETIILFAAIIVGGRGNNIGAILGALLVPVGFEEVTRLLNNDATIANVGPPGLIPALQWVAIGLLIIGFLWFRPQGVRPEPRRVFEGAPD